MNWIEKCRENCVKKNKESQRPSQWDWNSSFSKKHELTISAKNICDLLKTKKILRTEFDFWKRLAFSLLIQIYFRNSNTWCLQPKKTRQETVLKTNYKSCQINYIKNRKPEFQVTIQLRYSYNTIAIQIQYSYNTIRVILLLNFKLTLNFNFFFFLFGCTIYNQNFSTTCMWIQLKH